MKRLSPIRDGKPDGGNGGSGNPDDGNNGEAPDPGRNKI